MSLPTASSSRSMAASCPRATEPSYRALADLVRSAIRRVHPGIGFLEIRHPHVGLVPFELFAHEALRQSTKQDRFRRPYLLFVIRRRSGTLSFDGRDPLVYGGVSA